MADNTKRKETRGRKRKFTKEEAKEKKRVYDQQRKKGCINIGGQFDRWNSLKESLNVTRNDTLAKILLDRYLEERLMSTPIVTPAPHAHWTRMVARSTGTSDAESLPSGIEHLSDANQQIRQKRGIQFQIPTTESVNWQSTASTSTAMDTPALSTTVTAHDYSVHSEALEISMDLTMVDDSGDPDYIPDITIINHAATEDMDETCAHDDVHDCFVLNQEDDEPMSADIDVVDYAQIPKVGFIACESQLLKLANLPEILVCLTAGCNETVTIQMTANGSAIQLKWLCSNNHQCRRWMSQPVTRKHIPVMNVRMLASLLFSGNNYAKIRHMLKLAGLSFVSQPTYNRLQGHVLIPAVEEMWLTMRDERLRQLTGKEVIISGDGRMDSPGFCAKFCTYTVLNYDTKEILECVIVDKRQTDLKSTNMEMFAFKRMMATFREFGIVVKEVVTDAHLGIAAFMRKSHPEIKHSFDIWHGAKNLGKKLAAASLQRGSTDLKPWIGHVTNHFWYSSKTCDGNTQTLTVKMRSALHHTTDVHSWAFGQCEHAALTDEEREVHIPWLAAGSPAHDKLRQALCATRFTNSLAHYTNFRSTAELESFQNHILAYAAKRFAYSYDGYKARCYLAAIDYNEHLNRPAMTNKSGDVIYHRQFSKKAGHWTVTQMKEPKGFLYMEGLISQVIQRTEITTLRNPAPEKAMDDPSRIAPTIAPIPPPATADIVKEKEKHSRFKD